jgi:hypothetical protein
MPCRVVSIKDLRASLDFLSGIQGEPHGGPLKLFLGEVSGKDETCNDESTFCGSADRRGLGANDATFVIVLIIVSSFS